MTLGLDHTKISSGEKILFQTSVDLPTDSINTLPPTNRCTLPPTQWPLPKKHKDVRSSLINIGIDATGLWKLQHARVGNTLIRATMDYLPDLMHWTASSADTHFGSRSSTWDTCGVYVKNVFFGPLRPAIEFQILAGPRATPRHILFMVVDAIVQTVGGARAYGW